MSNSIFNTNPLKESESLELEQRLLNSVNIQFDYYSINCREIQKTPNAIHSIYRGNANRPNIIVNNNQYFPTYYQAVELAIYSKLHEGSHQAELVIKHIPISTYITPVYLCFFIYSTSSVKTTDTKMNTPSLVESINTIIQSSTPLDINISSLLTPYVFTKNIKKQIPITWQIYETINNNGNCMVILINKPLYIDSMLIDQIPQTKTPPFKLLNTIIEVDQSIESYVTANGGYAFSNDNQNEMECEIISDNEYGDIQVVQMPLQVGKDSTDMLYIMNIMLYVCIAIFIMLIQVTFSLSLLQCIKFILGRITGIDDEHNKTIYAYFLLIFIFFCIIVTFLIIGFIGIAGSYSLLMIVIGFFVFLSSFIVIVTIYYRDNDVKNIFNNDGQDGQEGVRV